LQSIKCVQASGNGQSGNVNPAYVVNAPQQPQQQQFYGSIPQQPQQQQFYGNIPQQPQQPMMQNQQQPTYQGTDQYVKQEPITNQGGYQNL
jgi:hypothetical protein